MWLNDPVEATAYIQIRIYGNTSKLMFAEELRSILLSFTKFADEWENNLNDY